MKKLIYIIPTILLLVQSVDYLFSGYLSYIRAVFLIAIVIYMYIAKRMKYDSVAKMIIVFFLYTLGVSFNSSNLYITIPGYLSVFASMSFYIISYNTIRTYSEFLEFKKLLIWIPVIFIVNIIIYTGFNIGYSVYGGYGVLKTGPGLHHNTIYTGVLIVVLSFVLIKYFKRKVWDVILIVTMMIIIVLSFRRTAIILIVICMLIYIIMGQKKQVMKYLLGITILASMTFPIYNEPLYNIIDARASRATFENGIENESRMLEMKVINEKIFEFKDKEYSLFGMEYLNSFGTYATSKFNVLPTRILHTDYAVILHGSGLVGMTIYFIIILLLVSKAIGTVRSLGYNNDISILYISLITILILVTFSGSLLNITFRTSIFILLGAVARIAENQKKLIINRE